MKKGLSLFAGYCILLACVVFSGVAMLSWFQTSYLLNKPQVYLSGLKVTMIITAGLTLMIMFAIFIVTRPFQKIMSKFQETGTPLSEDEEAIVMKTYSKMNIVSIVGIIIGFAIGNGVTVLVKYLAGKYNGTALHLTLAMIQACIYACFVSVLVVVVTDFMFAKYRSMLHIHDMHNYKAGWSLARTLRVTIVISILFIISNVLMVAFTVFDGTTIANAIPYVKRIIVATILVSIPTVGLTYLMLITLNKRISIAEKQIRNLSEGTATSLIDITNMDDFGLLTSSMNGLLEKERSLVDKILKVTKVIDEISKTLTNVSDEATNALSSVTESYNVLSDEGNKQREEISNSERDVNGLTSSVRQVETNILEQTAVMQESSAAITEMSENINSIANMTVKADEVSKNLTNVCTSTGASISQATAAINSISEASAEIEEIVKTIQKISSQTNLLAMNASIEAAHAGEAGKGFAVVAAEVRSLAGSSTNSAKDIQDKIADMASRVKAGVNAISLIDIAFKKIEDSVEQNSSITASITHALREQQIGAENNMRSTRQATDSTERVKELVTSQHEFTGNVDSSMKIVVGSTEEMALAIEAGVEAIQAMQQAVTKINETVKSNKVVVEELKNLMNEYGN